MQCVLVKNSSPPSLAQSSIGFFLPEYDSFYTFYCVGAGCDASCSCAYVIKDMLLFLSGVWVKSQKKINLRIALLQLSSVQNECPKFYSEEEGFLMHPAIYVALLLILFGSSITSSRGSKRGKFVSFFEEFSSSQRNQVMCLNPESSHKHTEMKFNSSQKSVNYFLQIA